MQRGMQALTTCGGKHMDEPFNELYYHGLMDQTTADQLLAAEQEDGIFLVRRENCEVGVNLKDYYYVSIWHAERSEPMHIKIEQGQMNEGYKLIGNEKWFPSILELVAYYRNAEDLAHPRGLLGDDGPFMGRIVRRPDWLLDQVNVKVFKDQNLGSGNFGQVVKGNARVPNPNNGVVYVINVAIKILHTNKFDMKAQRDLLGEAYLMRNLTHPNVVKFYGVCTKTDPMLIMELLSDSLTNHLRKTETMMREKARFVRDAAHGMWYLEIQGIMHRDLAARNCLLHANGTLKVADFGLARNAAILVDDHHSKPIRWMAIEVLQSLDINCRFTYTTKSDVWSFGVLMWEIYTDANCIPYSELLQNSIVRDRVIKGYPLSRPKNMPVIMVKLMEDQCKATNPEDRPTFKQVFCDANAYYQTLCPPDQENRRITFNPWG